MAKERMVTRTVNATEVDVFCIHKDTKETFISTVVLGGKYKDDDALFKAARKQIDTPEVKAISIEDKRTVTHLYAMPEADFIRTAKIADKEAKVESADKEAKVESEDK